MNKKTIISVVCILLLMTVFSGCGKKEKLETTTPLEETVITEPETTAETIETVEGVEEWDEETATESAPTTATEPTEKTEPTTEATTEPTTEPTTESTTEATTEPTVGNTEPQNNGEGTYAWYLSLTPEQQQSYFDTFESPADFFAWLNKAKADYEESQNNQTGDSPEVDLGDIVK